ncbi:type VII secretion protein EccB [Actinotignum timonense]|uniref:type VII secretion protein EccB n=1 Tax=Actinotignum TaxID=1653174 RepID=UPI00254DF28E|nr:type VII secretion protein EccB [Actinotignum timonense]MDK6905838.1 type VII secretion protein EccB [Actinotignum timonense]MDK8782535.1 type VII secretion protein EccB [Actinotignum timonense]MDY5138554.1 type VII secretion protein EccB [Actinotignum timonense]
MIMSSRRFRRRSMAGALWWGLPAHEEAPRPGLAGLAGALGLALAAAAGTGAARAISPQLPDGWEDGAVLIAAESGARYLSSGGILHPLTTLAGAYLLYPEGVETHVVPAARLADIPRGAPVGIPGAPDSLPSAAELRDPWLVTCPATVTDSREGNKENMQGTAAPLSLTASVPLPEFGGAVLVRTSSGLWLIAAGQRYRVDIPEAAFRSEFPDVPVLEAPPAWVELWAEGRPLAPLSVPAAGEPVGYLPGIGEARVGDLVVFGGSDGTRTWFQISSGGVLEPLSPTAFHLYRLSEHSARARVYALDPAARAHLSFRETGPGDGWPADLSAQPGPARVCAAFHAGRSFLVHAPDSPLPPSGTVLIAGTDAGSATLLQGSTLVDIADLDRLRRAANWENITPLELPLAWRALLPEPTARLSVDTLCTDPDGTTRTDIAACTRNRP